MLFTRDSRISAFRAFVQRRPIVAPLRWTAPLDAHEHRGVERPGRGIPLELTGARSTAADESNDVVPCGFERRHEGRPDHADAPLTAILMRTDCRTETSD